MNEKESNVSVAKTIPTNNVSAIPSEPAYPVALNKEEIKKLFSLLRNEPKKVAKFEKVSLEKWKDIPDILNSSFPMSEDDLKRMIEDLRKPQRSTETSAGYDFFMPFDLHLLPGREITIPTGIRVKMNDNYVLKIYPRSGLGFEYKVRFANTVGIIDSDYYYADNEGHIMINISNNTTDRSLFLCKGDKFCQGIFVEYGITVDDDEYEHAKRTGGMGSTGK